MKDIDNHSRSICRGVTARTESVHLIYSMDRKLGRKEGARTRPQHLFLKEAHSPRNFDRPPEFHKRTLVNNKRHTMTFHCTPTHPAWVELHKSTTFHTLTVSPPARLCLPFHLHLLNWLLLGQWRRRGNRSKVTPRGGACTPTSTGPASNSQLQKAIPNLTITHALHTDELARAHVKL